MSIKWLIFILKVILILLLLYIFSYLLLSWRGKYDSYSSGEGKEWAFDGTKGRSGDYLPFGSSFMPDLYQQETNLCRFYRPLIKLDSLLTKDHNIQHFADKWGTGKSL